MSSKFKFTREQIIQTTLELTREGGIAAITVRSIGEKLNSSVKMVFGQFSNMEEVIKGAKGSVYLLAQLHSDG